MAARDVLIPKVPVSLLDRLEEYRRVNGLRSRTAAIRVLLEEALG